MMSNKEKAVLDLIAFAEGTLGVSQNGYDVSYNHYTIKGWTPDTTMKHGGDKWLKQQGFVFKIKGVNITDIAAGRYQFLFSTWNDPSGGQGLAFSKNNQDLTALKLVKRRLGFKDFEDRSVSIDDLSANKADREKFDIFLNKISPEWASIPVSKDMIRYYRGKDKKVHNQKAIKKGDSFYGQLDETKKQTINPDSLYRIFLEALRLYDAKK